MVLTSDQVAHGRHGEVTLLSGEPFGCQAKSLLKLALEFSPSVRYGRIHLTAAQSPRTQLRFGECAVRNSRGGLLALRLDRRLRVGRMRHKH